ncbi:MAG: hypothetical protein WB952_15860 [Terriglobales bacterium]|jgi:hypothetical protein
MAADPYERWLDRVREALDSINMPMEEWQSIRPFDFRAEYCKGVNPDDAAMRANRFWWHEQNKSLKQECRKEPNCWLPRGHQGPCQPISQDSGAATPTYERGDYVKVEFPDEATGIGEWMWVRVSHCDEQKQLVFGTLDNEPLHDYGDQIRLGSELAVSFSQIREHRKRTEFTKQ